MQITYCIAAGEQAGNRYKTIMHNNDSNKPEDLEVFQIVILILSVIVLGMLVVDSGLCRNLFFSCGLWFCWARCWCYDLSFRLFTFAGLTTVMMFFPF